MGRAPSHQDDSPTNNPPKCDDVVGDSPPGGQPPQGQPPQGRECTSALPSESVSSKSIFLPFEIISAVLECLAAESSSCYAISGDRAAREKQRRVQLTFSVLCRVSKTWHAVARPFLYRSPHLWPLNYFGFTITLWAASQAESSFNPAPACSLIRRLDLSGQVVDGRGKLNAHVVHRVRQTLEEFVAPPKSYGYEGVSALSGCVRLRVLDLSVVVSRLSVEDLMEPLSRLAQLRTFHFPPDVFEPPPWKIQKQLESQAPVNWLAWPPKLEHLSLSGVVPQTLARESTLPSTLKSLHLSACSSTAPEIRDLVLGVGTQLTTLSIMGPMLHLGASTLDGVLTLCPGLTDLFVSAEHISSHFFRDLRYTRRGEGGSTSPSGAQLDAKDNAAKTGGEKNIGILPGHPLARLELDSSGPSGLTQGPVAPGDVLAAVYEGRLPNLRVVRVSHHLGWTVGGSFQRVCELTGVLQARAAMARDRDLSGVGVWEFGGADDNEVCGSKA